MTPNRARKTDTAKLLAEENISHREAAYKASNRTLMLPDGNIHDFATGPVRYLAKRGSGITELLNQVAEEAKSKSWSIIRLSEFDDEPTPAVSDLPKAPALIIALSDHLAPARGLFVELEEGRYEGLNVIIMREPWLSDYEQPLTGGRTIHVEAPPRSTPKFDNVALAKARIAFALRYADMLATGADDITALGVVAHALELLGTPEAAAIAGAARSSINPVRNGFTVAQHFKAEHEELLGTHLVEVFYSAWLSGRQSAGLRDAAATLEADLRIGLIA